MERTERIRTEAHELVAQQDLDVEIEGFLPFCRHLEREMAREADNAIVIDGYEGSGKSNLGILVSRTIKPDFNPGRESIYKMQDWHNVFDANIKGRVYLVDEAGNILFSRDFASTDSKFIVKLLMQARILRATLILVLPSVFFLDRYVRESRMKYRFRMDPFNLRNNQGRTMAMLQTPFMNWRTGDVRMTDVALLTDIPSVRDLDRALWSEYEARKEAEVRAFSGEHKDLMRLNKLAQQDRIQRLEERLAR